MNSQDVTNVHVLPRNLDEEHLKNAEDTINYMKNIRKDFSDEVVEFVMEQTVSCIQQFGVLNDGKRVKVSDLLMLENAIASAIYRYYNLEHPLHPITDDVFVFEDDNESEDENETLQQEED